VDIGPLSDDRNYPVDNEVGAGAHSELEAGGDRLIRIRDVTRDP
jgi:hypothetical protein